MDLNGRKPNPLRNRRVPRELYRGISEFGEVMAQMMETTPGAIGTVLADARGEPIDFAHDPDEIDELEIQIVGAQIGQSIDRLNKTAIIFGLGHPTVLLHATRGNLLTRLLQTEYLLTVVLARSANIARAMDRFAQLSHDVDLLLG